MAWFVGTPASSYSLKDTMHARDGAHSGAGTVAPCVKLDPLARRAAKCGMCSSASCAPSQSHLHVEAMGEVVAVVVVVRKCG